MELIDSHIHLDFYDNFNQALSSLLASEGQAIFVTHLPELFKKYYPIIIKQEKLRIALGYHPILVDEYPLDRIMFSDLVSKTDFVGEVGLDYATTSSQKTRASQRDAFSFICNIARNKVFSIHSRAAEEDVLIILKDNNVRRAIFHWYTGSERTLEQILDSGYYLSINPMMLKTVKGVSILKRIPLDRMLIESDGPFAKYNGKIVQPSMLGSIYDSFSDFFEASDLRQIVWQNFLSITHS